MLKTLFTIAFICIQMMLFGQSCLPGGATFIEQAQIDNFAAANPGCKEIEGHVLVQGQNIKNLDGLMQLERISGDLYILNNDSLENLLGLANLKSVGHDMRIQSNAILEYLDGLEQLTAVEGDFFYIGENRILRSLEGLNHLDSVAGIFQVWGTDSLRSLQGLEALKWVGSRLSIFNNTQLDTLAGLSALTYVGDDFRLENNAILRDISVLQHAVEILGALAIIDNTLLSNCAVQAVCEYLQAPSSFIAITMNGIGCQSEEEVSSACMSATHDYPDRASISIFPNPASDQVTFLPETLTFDRVQIRDVAGRLLLSEKYTRNTLDISKLNPGFYWLEMLSPHWSAVQPLVKQ